MNEQFSNEKIKKNEKTNFYFEKIKKSGNSNNFYSMNKSNKMIKNSIKSFYSSTIYAVYFAITNVLVRCSKYAHRMNSEGEKIVLQKKKIK